MFDTDAGHFKMCFLKWVFATQNEEQPKTKHSINYFKWSNEPVNQSLNHNYVKHD